MAEVIMMKHPQTGVIKKGFVGFSWTVFFFGWLAMVFRGDVILGICIFLAEIASLVAIDLQYIIWQMLLLSLVQILFAFTVQSDNRYGKAPSPQSWGRIPPAAGTEALRYPRSLPAW